MLIQIYFLNLAIITLLVSMIINYIPQNHWKKLVN